MNILHVNLSGTQAGGIETYIRDVSTALGEKGHASHLVYLAEHDPADLMSASTHVPLGTTPASLTTAKRAIERVIEGTKSDIAYVHAVYSPDLVEWLTQRLPTIVHVHCPYPVCPGLALFLRRSERVCPFRPGLVCFWNAQWERCCWGRNPWRHLRALLRTYGYRRAYARAGRILVGSTYMQQLLIREGFSAPISVCAGVLLSERCFVQMAEPEPNLILYAGRLVQEKGLQHLLRALALVKQPWRLQVAGDGPMRAQCEALARQLNIADRVLFRGWLGPEAMDVVLGQAAFAVMPSLWPEPFGLVGAETFARGHPVVAYAVGGVTDWLEHQETGLLVAPGDIPALAQSIQQLLQDPARCRQMGQRARNYARQHWLPEHHVDELVQHFYACQRGARA